MSTEFDGRSYEFSLRSLCMASGRSSGLMISIKDFLEAILNGSAGTLLLEAQIHPDGFT